MYWKLFVECVSLTFESPGLKTRLEAMLPDNPPTVSDMDAIFTVITSPDSVKAKY
ncbi:hypothetical protein KU344_14645, partial [Salmonella enterica subsp. enterica serovar Montevideo]|nr:hypothetical protein [Salmonella enterica subsp. enterica serovar Montevideo]